MKLRFTYLVVVLVALNIAACGKHEESAKVSVAAVKDGYNATLAEGIQFAAKPNYPSFIKSVAGMSDYEATGRWSDGKKVTFTFAQNLPASFTLNVDLTSTFGPNIGKATQIRVGNWEQQMIAQDGGNSTQSFQVKTDSAGNTIEFVIPEPKSPKELGMGNDERMLGIMFKRLIIIAN